MKITSKTALLILLIVLTGCGALSEKEEPHQTDYIMVSQGKVSMVYSVFLGGVNYCKVTKHGIPHNSFAGKIDYDGKNCKVQMEAGRAISE